MASVKDKISQFARSEKGQQLTRKAQELANDPKNKQKINGAMSKLSSLTSKKR